MGDLGKLIAAKGFKNLPKVQKIAQSGHTEWHQDLGTFKELSVCGVEPQKTYE